MGKEDEVPDDLIEAVARAMWAEERYEFGGPEWDELLRKETFRPQRIRALARAAVLAQHAYTRPRLSSQP